MFEAGEAFGAEFGGAGDVIFRCPAGVMALEHAFELAEGAVGLREVVAKVFGDACVKALGDPEQELG